MNLVYGQDQLLREWVSRQLFDYQDAFDEKSVCIGVEKDGQIIAAVLYNNMMTDNHCKNYSIEMSVASTDKSWCNKKNLRAFFAYPFMQLGLRRVSTLCSASELELIDFNTRLGFTKEGLHRQYHPNGDDAVSFSMLRHECRWL